MKTTLNILKKFRKKMHDAISVKPKDKTQLIKLIRFAQEKDLIDSDALLMIEGVLTLSELKVRDIMVSNSLLISICEDQSLDEIISIISQSGHSRFPVMDEEKLTVIGILHAKNLLPFFKKEAQQAENSLASNEDNFNIKDLLRPVPFIPESKEVNKLLKDFRVNRYHMAIIVDEYGQPSGFITIEDILEKIVGAIEDEFDPDPDLFIKEKKHPIYLVKASTPIDEFNHYFNTSLSDAEFDTLAGVITQLFGYLPKAGEEIMLENIFSIKILESNQRRLDLLEISVQDNPTKQSV